MIAIMGLPPLNFLQNSEKSKQYWNDKGNPHTLLPCLRILTWSPGEWIGQVPIPEKSLESSETRLQEGEEKELFLIWIRKMLQWKPEDRSSIEDVIMDEWFLADMIESGQVVRGPEEIEAAAVRARRRAMAKGNE
jgi:serine/threonine-protein kinase SRPK3